MGVMPGYRPHGCRVDIPPCVLFVSDEVTSCPKCGREEYQGYVAYGYIDGDRGRLNPLPREKWTKMPPFPCPDCSKSNAPGRNGYSYRKPGSYAEASPDVAAYIEAAGKGVWPWLKGPYRSGKTASAHEVCACMAASGVRAEFVSVRDYCAAMADARDYGTAMSQSDVLAKYGNAPFLALDDFGREPVSASSSADLWALIDRRAAANRATLFTSNYTVDGACKRHASADASTAGAIAARIRERCAEVTVK